MNPLEFVAAHPELAEAAVDLVKAMLARSHKDTTAAQIKLRRRVDAELIRRGAMAAARASAPRTVPGPAWVATAKTARARKGRA